MHGSRRLVPALAFLLASSLSGCGGGSPGAAPGRAPTPPTASEEEWRALALPRPAALAGAPRVSVATLEVVGRAGWTTPAGLEPTLGATELVVAGLLRRQDVDFVERRRFAAAAEAERGGSPRPEGAPPAGVSRGAEYVAQATWANVGSTARLDVRLAAAASGEVLATWRATTPPDADLVSLARLAVAGTLAALDSLGVRPAWQDPAPAAAPPTYRPAGVPASAVEDFLRGLAAEEAWQWEAARRGYQSALAGTAGGFPEAAAALARTGRLRNGGTLGAS